ncbi:MAG: efflux RND transporter permease subunit, partial [Ktedonobacteraceae bacterium]
MWIVRIALRRPYTFIVAAILILILGLVAISRAPVDIFPDIDIPVVSIIWNYNGLSPEDMSDRIIYGYERGVTTTVNDIEHIESQSYTGIGVVKVFFQPGADITSAVAQVTSVAQSSLRGDPPGTVPPFIIAYNASTVPILQLALSGAGLSEQELNDASTNFIRPALVTVHGAVLPASYGGKRRQIQVDLNIPDLQARGLSANDVVNAISAQNLILPGGTAKI